MGPEQRSASDRERGGDLTPTIRHQVVLVFAAIVAAVGVIDAVVSDEWDFFAIFVLTLLLLIVLLMQLNRRRPSIPVRADLARWLRVRADETGETVDVLADRAIAAYRNTFVDIDERSS